MFQWIIAPSIRYSFFLILAFMARRYSHCFVGKIDVSQVEPPILTSTRTKPNQTTVLSCIHFIKLASWVGNVTKYQDHFPAVYRQSGSENERVVLGIYCIGFRYFLHLSSSGKCSWVLFLFSRLWAYSYPAQYPTSFMREVGAFLRWSGTHRFQYSWIS